MSERLTPSVQELVRSWFEAREESRLPSDREMDAALARAVSADLDSFPDYLPSHDQRVDWARSMVRRRWRCDRPRGERGLEAVMEFLLGRVPAGTGGKMRAAGD